MKLMLILYHNQLSNYHADRVLYYYLSFSQLLVTYSEQLVNNIVTMLGRERAAAY